MANPENKFNIEEQQAFDRIFPPSKILSFEEEGTDDWMNIFDVLKAFDCFPDVKPEGKESVVKLFSENRYGAQIHTKAISGGVMVYKRNVTPLLKASLEVFWKAFEFFTDDFKKDLDKILTGPIRNPEHDWQK